MTITFAGVTVLTMYKDVLCHWPGRINYSGGLKTNDSILDNKL